MRRGRKQKTKQISNLLFAFFHALRGLDINNPMLS